MIISIIMFAKEIPLYSIITTENFVQHRTVSELYFWEGCVSFVIIFPHHLYSYRHNTLIVRRGNQTNIWLLPFPKDLPIIWETYCPWHWHFYHWVRWPNTQLALQSYNHYNPKDLRSLDHRIPGFYTVRVLRSQGNGSDRRILLFGSKSISGNMLGSSSNPRSFEANYGLWDKVKPPSSIRCWIIDLIRVFFDG